MAMRDYSDEFKADAVALYESTPGATYKSIAADLGINRNTLRNWVLCSRKLRSGVPDAARDARTVVRIPDLFRRDFAAPEPGIGYMGDITCLPLENGEFLNLATVLDRFSRKVVGWSIVDHMRTGLVADALKMAARTRGGLDGAVFHSHHGAQYGARPSLPSATSSKWSGRWARPARARTTRPARASTRPSNARPSRAAVTTATPPPADGSPSPGWPATTPAAGTPPTATSAPTNTNAGTTPLSSRSPRDQSACPPQRGQARGLSPDTMRAVAGLLTDQQATHHTKALALPVLGACSERRPRHQHVCIPTMHELVSDHDAVISGSAALLAEICRKIIRARGSRRTHLRAPEGAAECLLGCSVPGPPPHAREPPVVRASCGDRTHSRAGVSRSSAAAGA